MKLLPPALFALGYFLGGWLTIRTLVTTLERGDPKLAGAVGFYYGIWICFYLPVAAMGAIFLAGIPGTFRKRMIAAGISLPAILAAMFFSFYLDVHWPVLLVEYLGFAVGFWILAKRMANTDKRMHATGVQPMPDL